MRRRVHESVCACPYEEDDEQGLFSRFEPGARSLPAGFQVWPRLKPLSVDIVFVKGLAVTVLGGMSVHVDLGRPAGAEKVPAILA